MRVAEGKRSTDKPGTEAKKMPATMHATRAFRRTAQAITPAEFLVAGRCINGCMAARQGLDVGQHLHAEKE